MKAVIVGSGITGCAAAIKLKKMGFDVDVYDYANSIGGVLNDIKVDNEYYYNGCQYFNTNAEWLKDILNDSVNDYELQEFKLSYGSYTDIFGGITTHNDFAAPVFKCPLESADLQVRKPEDLRSRLLNYPKNIAEPLLQWVDRYVDTSRDIHSNCAIGVQLSRVYMDYNDEHLMQLKNDNALLGDIYGVPRSIINPDVPQASVCLPKHGFNHFFDLLEKEMRDMGINIFLGSPVTPKASKGLKLFCRNDSISADIVVWAGNPVPLIMQAGFGKLENPDCKMKLTVCDVKCTETLNTGHYIQVYAKDSSITRIYFYQSGDTYKATIESFDDEMFDIESMVKQANDILQTSGFNIQLTHKATIKQRRHIFYTNDDIKKMHDFYDFAHVNNIIAGAWDLFSRDEKIHEIFKNINRKF